MGLRMEAALAYSSGIWITLARLTGRWGQQIAAVDEELQEARYVLGDTLRCKKRTHKCEQRSGFWYLKRGAYRTRLRSRGEAISTNA